MASLSPSASRMPGLRDGGLQIHDTRQRRLVAFAPIDPSHVRLYACGPTVYDRPHLGNARAAVVVDVLVRLLRALYPRVTYVRNITDIDDKINERSRETGEPIAAITARTAADYHADMAALGVLPPDVEPRATEHVPEIVALIERLIGRGHAYVAEGHVLFSVASYAAYGAFSGRDPEELLAGARIDVAPYKRDPGDFVLWKPSPPALPGWDSPWGRGRPGWHIECSAMAWRYLGENFDLHLGGQDLIFPHHENEVAQSCCAFPGSEFARHWMHNGMLLVDGQKMSKSLGNFRTVQDVLADAPAEAIRLLLLRAQYRASLDFSDAALAECRRMLDRWYRALGRTPDAPHSRVNVPDAVIAALCDDLNTPAAIAAMHGLADAAMAGDVAASAGLRAAGGLLGVLAHAPSDWFQADELAATVTAMIDERRSARAARDFARADAIRAALEARGVLLEDGPAGTTWRRA